MLTEAFAISFIIGVAALRLLLGFIDRGRLHWFGFYLVALGIIQLLAPRLEPVAFDEPAGARIK